MSKMHLQHPKYKHKPACTKNNFSRINSQNFEIGNVKTFSTMLKEQPNYCCSKCKELFPGFMEQAFLSREAELLQVINEEFPTVTVEQLNDFSNFMAAEGYIQNLRLFQVQSMVTPHGFFAVEARKNGILFTVEQLEHLRNLYLQATLPLQKDVEVLCKASRFAGCRMAIEKLNR